MEIQNKQQFAQILWTLLVGAAALTAGWIQLQASPLTLQGHALTQEPFQSGMQSEDKALIYRSPSSRISSSQAIDPTLVTAP